ELARAPSAMQHNYYRDEQEGVQVVDQAQRAVVTPTSTMQRKSRAPTRAGSYRTLNDDAYASDMDELCDPEYYLNFNSSTTARQTPVPPPRHHHYQQQQQQQHQAPLQHAGAKSVQLPRKKMNFDAVT
uniref:Uncharacterized protein n=2 Tax=Caenorhabditis japonica TaxID=281687 RepID=A0A8R1ISL3_CAEJA